jgi:hypothetical protein
LPLAPTRFSTTTGCPSEAESWVPIRRAMMSVGPPGGKATSMWIGLSG